MIAVVETSNHFLGLVEYSIFFVCSLAACVEACWETVMTLAVSWVVLLANHEVEVGLSIDAEAIVVPASTSPVDFFLEEGLLFCLEVEKLLIH